MLGIWSTFEWMLKILRDVIKVLSNVRMQSSRAGEEASYKDQEAPAQGEARPG